MTRKRIETSKLDTVSLVTETPILFVCGVFFILSNIRNVDTDSNNLAIALAIYVLPVPGGPYKRIPFGSFAPILFSAFCSFRHFTIKRTDVLAVFDCGEEEFPKPVDHDSVQFFLRDVFRSAVPVGCYMYLAANHPAILRMKNTKRG